MTLQISVVTAVFDRVATIREAIESVSAQTWPSVQHVIIDGASTDGTLDILNSCSDRFAILVSERDAGIYDALNKGIRCSNGDVVGFLHSDDAFASADVLSHVARAFDDPDVGAVYGDLEYVRQDDVSKVVRHWRSGAFVVENLRRGWMPPHPTFYVRREIYEKFGLFDISFRIAADYDSMLRILGSGTVHTAYIPKVFVKMRVGGASNRSLCNTILKSREDYRAIRKNQMGGAYTLLRKNLAKLPQFFYKEA